MNYFATSFTYCILIDTFRIDQVNLIGLANLIVNSELDRELIPLYIIVVKATDMGNPVRSSTMVCLCCYGMIIAYNYWLLDFKCISN